MNKLNKLTIQYFSDIHLEFYDLTKIHYILSKIIPQTNICVLAGDIGYPFSKTYEVFLKGINNKFEHVFLIHGNHEYYQLKQNKNKSIQQIKDKTLEIINDLKNIHFLDNSYYDINDYRFVGSTLWSKIDNPSYLINDNYNIKELSVDKINLLHNNNKTYINNILNLETNKKIIMITHHLPTYNAINIKYKHYIHFNQCFASNSDELIKKPIICWIFGHTHSPTEIIVNDIKLVANPIGYPHENTNIDFNKCILL